MAEMIEYQLWGSKNDRCASVLIQKYASQSQLQLMVADLDSPELKMQFEAENWQDAREHQHRYNGWEDYDFTEKDYDFIR